MTANGIYEIYALVPGLITNTLLQRRIQQCLLRYTHASGLDEHILRHTGYWVSFAIGTKPIYVCAKGRYYENRSG